ncbi:MAG: adenine deaminase [Desulfobacteraceae bacterium]|nr:MAG: adenine deaminase [Desulfobacteraceae bacterium]
MSSNQPLADLAARDAQALMQVALGKKPGDLAVINARVANVYTGEILENQSIVSLGKWIAYTGDAPDGMIGAHTEVIDAAGRVVIPGLIDGHTHLAAFFNMAEFIRYAAPGGTTTVVTEAFEPYAVGGYAGIVDFLDSLADQPIKLFATAPPMVSLSRKLLGIDPQDLERLLAREEILGLGESYWQGVMQSPQRLLPAMQATLVAGKKLEGHSAGAKNGKLAAYAAIGISSCHEPITAEEALARMRLGIHVMAREGNVRRDLAAIARIRSQGVDLRRLTIVSDGIDPGALLSSGYMEAVVQKAIEYGFTPMEALQMTTLNVAEHFAIDHLVGGIAPGRYADLVLIPEIDTITAELVISNGRVIARDGRLLVAPRAHAFSDRSRNTVALPRELTADDFTIRAGGTAAKAQVSVIEMVTDLVTREQVLSWPAPEGCIRCAPEQDVIKVAAVDRRHAPGKIFTALLRGFGLRAGAVASSVAWDTANLIVIGAHEADMALCINRIRELQGGIVVARQGEILAELPLPNLGMVADLAMIDLSRKLSDLTGAVQSLGTPFHDPLLTLATLTGAAIPYLRICEDGLVHFKSGEVRGVLGADSEVARLHL